ncbi:MAG TPA: plastocyanin/azurin family copper-binding protein [Gemmatimonadales bacterium]
MEWKSLLLALCTAALLGCSGDSQPVDPGAGGLRVAVRNNLFAPATLQVPVNSTVMWEWSSGGVDHNVTFETGPSSGNRSSGTFERTFPTAGTFAYICTIHGAQVMSGVVNVAAATGGGGGSGGGGGGSYP